MEIRENILLSKYTTLKVGGPARFFCEAKDEEEIIEALKLAREKKLPVFVLGGGSNLLVSDKGFNGIVIQISNFKFQISNFRIICDGGVMLSKAVNESVKSGLTSLEWAAGIPGTVGGAIRGNAGAFGSSMSKIVETIKVVDIKKINANNQKESGIRNYESGNCGFGYRESIFKKNSNLVILSVVLRLKKGKKEEIKQKVKDIIKQRKEAQPFDFPSSGSFFKNPTVKNQKLLEDYEKDIGNKEKGEVVPAGYIIEALGLKGKKIGGAMVSQNHGNFLVNTGSAKAEDFIILAAIIKTRARNKFGVQLQEEVQMVGF